MISDAAMFEARRFIVENQRYPNNQNPPVSPGVDNALLQVAGRHRFWLNTSLDAQDGTDPVDTRRYATLRIDPENGIISGDLHSDIHRKAWQLSWSSQALFHIGTPSGVDAADWAEMGWDLFGICDVATAEPASDPSLVAALALRLGDDDRLAAVRLIVTNRKGKVISDLSQTDTDTKPPRATFRYLKPIHLADGTVWTEPDLRRAVDEALGPDGDAIGQALLDAGSGLHWRKHDANLQRAKGLGQPFQLLAPYQWSDDPYSYAILFSGADSDVYGTVPDLNRPNNPLAKVRFGAIVYVKAIIEQIKAQSGLDDFDANLQAIVRRIQRTYIHEVGHLLNLPHTWQRGQFPMPPIDSNPAARSWMAYPSRFPLGDFMITSRKRLASGPAVDALKLEDAARANQTALATPHFTPQERKWMWHAPFDHISPGGPYFTAGREKPLRLGDPSEQAKLTLRLLDAPDPLPEDGIVTLARGTGTKFKWEALVAEAVLDVKEDFVRKHPFHFAFQSPMLCLLVREEYPSQADRHTPRRVIEIPAAQLSGDWKRRMVDGTLAPADLPFLFHDRARNPSEVFTEGETRYRRYRRLAPFFDSQKVLTLFGNQKGGRNPVFTLQVVLRPVGTTPIYSNLVKVRFLQRYTLYNAPEVAVLTDPNLGRFLDATAYFSEDLDVATLEAPSPHSDADADYRPVFADLIAKIAALGPPGDLSPSLFALLALREAPRLELFSQTMTRSSLAISDTNREIFEQQLQTAPTSLKNALQSRQNPRR